MADASADAGWLAAAVGAVGAVAGGFFLWLGQRITGKANEKDATTRRFEALFEAQAEEIKRGHEERLAEREAYRSYIRDKEAAFAATLSEVHSELRNVRQWANSLVRLLQKAGVADIPLGPEPNYPTLSLMAPILGDEEG